MKFKKIMLMTLLLLAILTIGAASAAEDSDALAVEDTGDEQIVEAPVDDTVVSDDNGEVLEADDEPLPDENYYIAFENDNITNREDKVCQISDTPGGADCRASVFANGTLVFDEPIETYYVYSIYAKELNGTFDGLYNLKVVYTSPNGTKWYNEHETYFDNITGQTDIAINPSDFNVTFADNELDVDADKDTTAVRFFVPAYVSDGRVEIRYGEDNSDTYYRYISGSHSNSYIDVSLKYITTDIGVYNLVVTYINSDDDDSVELASGILNVTKNYFADDFIELDKNNIQSATDSIFYVHELNGQKAVGKVSVFYNDTCVFTRTYDGGSACLIAGKDIVGYFEGECIFNVTYERDDDAKQYSKELTVNFINPISNKALTPEDFNVTFPNKEITDKDGNKVIMRYFIPEGIDEYYAILKVRYGSEEDNYQNIFLDKGDINKTMELTFEELYIFDSGTFNLEVSYYVDQDKILDIANSTLNVTKSYAPTDFMELYAKTITSPTDYVCIVHDENGLNGLVTIYANGNVVFNKTLITSTIDGVHITPQNLTVSLEGSYNVSVVYSRNGDKNYSKEATISFNIPKPLAPEDFNVTFANNEVDVDDGTTPVVSWDWPNAVGSSGFIKIDVQGGSGIPFQKGTATSGKATLSDLHIFDTGVYNITVTYGGDTFIKNGTIKVTKTYTDADFIYVYSTDVTSPQDHIADVWDSETGIGINGVVEVYANNVKVYSMTYSGTDSGKPIAAKDLSGNFNGQYTIKVVYNRADGKVFTQSETVKFVDIVGVQLSTSITASSMTVTYNGNDKLVATLKDANGKPISNVDVYISIMGVKYPLKTDNNGQIKQSVGTLTPKKHDVVITFEGNAAYKKSTKTVTVTVKKATPKLSAPKKTFKKSVKTKKYTVTLKSNVNKPLAKVKVTLTVKGKKYSGKTNAKGKVTFKITNLKKKGTYKPTVKSAGNSYYNAKSVKAKIVVK